MESLQKIEHFENQRRIFKTGASSSSNSQVMSRKTSEIPLKFEDYDFQK